VEKVSGQACTSALLTCCAGRTQGVYVHSGGATQRIRREKEHRRGRRSCEVAHLLCRPPPLPPPKDEIDP
jgi:hypothetical protein